MGKHFRGTDQPSIHHQITGKNPIELINGPHYCEDKIRCRRHNGRLHLAFLHYAQGETKTTEENKNAGSIKENDFPFLTANGYPPEILKMWSQTTGETTMATLASGEKLRGQSEREPGTHP